MGDENRHKESDLHGLEPATLTGSQAFGSTDCASHLEADTVQKKYCHNKQLQQYQVLFKNTIYISFHVYTSDFLELKMKVGGTFSLELKMKEETDNL